MWEQDKPQRGIGTPREEEDRVKRQRMFLFHYLFLALIPLNPNSLYIKLTRRANVQYGIIENVISSQTMLVKLVNFKLKTFFLFHICFDES